MSNEAFEKWFENTVLNDNIHDVAEWAWQAAKADSEREIAMLKVRVGDVTQAYQEKVNELQAHINNLREALNAMRDTFDIGGDVTSVENNALYKADKALASTPAQSLQEHDDEVIEMVVTLLKDSAWGDGIIDMRVDDLIEDVRALKG